MINLNQKLKKRFISLAFAFIFTFLSTQTANAYVIETNVQPQISAQSAILIEANSGTVIFQQEADKQLSMASTTKIMTALIALEYAEQNDNPIVEITEQMVLVEGSSMGLLPGYKLSLHDLAAGMMMTSGNDAANSIALFVAGSQEDFAKLMNEKAAKIGMKNTNFVTPSGLDDEMHYTNAYDMALLGSASIKNSSFAEIVKNTAYKVAYTEPAQTIRYRNHNKLLSMYDGCIGIKTGFTKKSGRCLVSAAERDGVTLIAVTLNAPDDWTDHMTMFDYGFAETELVNFDESSFYSEISVVGADKEKIMIKGGMGSAVLPKNRTSLNKVVCLPKFIYADIKYGDVVGYIEYYNSTNRVAKIPIFADENVEYSEKQTWFEKVFK